jgi:hypothetical protein
MKQKHYHYDMILAWASGEKLQWRYKGEKEWKDFIKLGNNDSPSWNRGIEYRIKPDALNWFKNIPEQGILCEVWDVYEKFIDVIIDYNSEGTVYPFKGKMKHWIHAKPLNNKDIQEYVL